MNLKDYGLEVETREVPSSLAEPEKTITMTESQLEKLLEDTRQDAYNEGFSNGVNEGMNRK